MIFHRPKTTGLKALRAEVSELGTPVMPPVELPGSAAPVSLYNRGKRNTLDVPLELKRAAINRG